ncbi:MAG: YpdA family putative bacillithiol disulfide reductase [Spirochaetia bacterium]|nr:YpdA family putative bacillithiol disulfide reductase [Spirochaetia bacterium]
MLDSIVIGAGPAGLAVACEFQKKSISYLVFDKGSIANHISQFPAFMNFFSSREFLEIDKFPLSIPEEKPDRRQYLAYLRSLVKTRNLKIKTYSTVIEVKKNADNIFETKVRFLDGSEEWILSKTVVVACGAYEKPRMLNVNGEELPHVKHHFSDVHDYYGRKVLVVGGRNSAIETALLLFRAGSEVTLSYRKYDFSESSIKYWIRPDIEKRVEKEEIKAFFGTNVKEFSPGKTTLINSEKDEIVVENDFVLLMTGYEPPLDFMKQIGVPFQENSPVPLHDPKTLETNEPGMFIAGVVTAGNISGKIFIENSRDHGKIISARLSQILGV